MGTFLWDSVANSDFATASRSRSQQHSSSTVELVDDIYMTIDESWLFTTSRSTVTLLIRYFDLFWSCCRTCFYISWQDFHWQQSFLASTWRHRWFCVSPTANTTRRVWTGGSCASCSRLTAPADHVTDWQPTPRISIIFGRTRGAADGTACVFHSAPRCPRPAATNEDRYDVEVDS